MRITIVGPGAIGSLFAAFLARAGHDVSLLDHKPERARRLAESGLTLTTAAGEFAVSVKAAADPNSLSPADLMIFCVKAFSTDAAAKHAAPCSGYSTAFLTLQNGLGNVEMLAKSFGRERIIGGVTGHGATLTDIGKVTHTGAGETIIGESNGKISPRVQAIKALFDSAGLPVTLTENLTGALWGKAVINSAVNPLAALTRRLNGDLLKDDALAELLGQVAAESAGIATASGIELPFADPAARVRSVCEQTAANTNSMLADVLNRRPTEIGQINGAVAAAAHKAGLPAPLNNMLTTLVKALEAGYANRVE